MRNANYFQKKIEKEEEKEEEEEELYSSVPRDKIFSL